MSEICLETCIGIGDCLIMKSQIEQLKYNKVIIKPNMSLLSWRGNSSKYANFILDLYKKTYFEDRYTISPVEKGSSVNCEHLFKYFGVNITKPNSKSFPHKVVDIPDKPYITISTKCRYIKSQEYEKIKDNFFKTIKSLEDRYAIVVVGEKDNVNNAENASLIERGDLYNLYPDIIKYKINFLDKTRNNYGEDMSMDSFLEDCYILNKSKYNIVLGIGGNFCMSYVYGNIICLYKSRGGYSCINSIVSGEYDYITFVEDHFLNKLNNIDFL